MGRTFLELSLGTLLPWRFQRVAMEVASSGRHWFSIKENLAKEQWRVEWERVVCSRGGRIWSLTLLRLAGAWQLKTQDRPLSVLLFFLIPYRQMYLLLSISHFWNVIEKNYSRKILRTSEEIKGLLKARWKELGLFKKRRIHKLWQKCRSAVIWGKGHYDICGLVPVTSSSHIVLCSVLNSQV